MIRPFMLLPLVPLGVVACAPGGYTRAEVVYAEPAQYEYVVPADRVVVVTREVLVQRGYVVYRVETHGPNRIVWARRGDDDVVRVFVSPDGGRVAVRGLAETRDRGKHKGWAKNGHADDVMTDIDGRLREHRDHGERRDH
ncbi:MAG TPA: hypothetical protein VGV12_04940 [Gemmatimonadales bacterium]|nr:hypothetical protein [Gemmatimonadales bacterium]